MIKKCLAFIIAFLLISGSLPNQLFRLSSEEAADRSWGFFTIKAGAAGEDIYNYVSSGGITMITGTKVTLNGAITLPSMLGGFPVTQIGAYAFENCTGITSVSFPDSITNINDFAFYGCRALQSVTLSNQLKIIEACAFRDCVSLASFHMPDAVTGLGSSVFWGCSLLSDVTLSNHLSSIPINTFLSCSALLEILIPQSVIQIGRFAFSSTALKSVIIPSSVTFIEDHAFSFCRQLESAELPPDLMQISASLFEGCSKLRSINIPSGVTAILTSAFKNCSALTDVNLNNGLQTIGQEAFAWCQALQVIQIPSTVTLIGDSAFKYCFQLISATIPQTSVTIGTDGFCSGNLTLYCNPGDVVQYAQSHNIPYSSIYPVTITFNANGGTGGTTVTQNCGTKFPSLPVIVKTGYHIYQWQPEIPVVTPNVSTTYTVIWSINWCAITFDANGGTGGTTVHKFYGETLSAPAVARELYLFDGWAPPVPSTVPEQDTTYTAQWRPIYQYIVSNGKAVITGCDTAVSGTLTVPPALGGYPVSGIGERAFESCSDMTGISIPDSITFISDYAFKDCTALVDIDISKNLIVIGTGAFLNTAWLNAQPVGPVYIGNIYYTYKGLMLVNTKITVLASTVSIADSALSGRSGISKVTLPESLVYIGAKAFYGCTGLTTILIPENVQGIGKQAFTNCTALEYCCYPKSYGHEYADANSITHTLVAKITFSANGGTGGISAVIPCGTALTAPTVTKQNFVFSGWSPALPGTVPTVNSAVYTAQWSRVPVSLSPNENTSAVIDANHFIYGLAPGITRAVFESEYMSISGDGRLEYSHTESGLFGTGTQVRLIDNLTDELLGTYTLVIFGDINGDGNIDSSDAGAITDYENFIFLLEPADNAASLMSADLNGDGNIDTSDAGLIVDVENFLLTVDQTTGLVY